MNAPDFRRVMETFILIPPQGWGPSAHLQLWQGYLDILRKDVAPLINKLQSKGFIKWYSFLVHNSSNGVPTSPSDQNLYIHLRLEIGDSIDEATLRKEIPNWCKMTQRMPIPNSLDKVDLNALKIKTVEEGYRIFGESCEWTLRMLESHDLNIPIPPENIGQFLHYIGNQQMVRAIGIPL